MLDVVGVDVLLHDVLLGGVRVGGLSTVLQTLGAPTAPLVVRALRKRIECREPVQRSSVPEVAHSGLNGGGASGIPSVGCGRYGAGMRFGAVIDVCHRAGVHRARRRRRGCRVGPGLLLGGGLGSGRLGHPRGRRDGHRADPPRHAPHPGRKAPPVGPRVEGRVGRPAVRRSGDPRGRPGRAARQLAGLRGRRGPGRARAQARPRRSPSTPASWAGSPSRMPGNTSRRPPSPRCVAPPPVQTPHPPVWCVGMLVPGRTRQRSLERAARWQGVFPAVAGGSLENPGVAPHACVPACRLRRVHRHTAGGCRADDGGLRRRRRGRQPRLVRHRSVPRCSSGRMPVPRGGWSRGGTFPTPSRGVPRCGAVWRSSALRGEPRTRRRPGIRCGHPSGNRSGCRGVGHASSVDVRGDGHPHRAARARCVA